METICKFEGMKEISVVTSASEVRLPEYNNMRKIYLRTKQEVNLALAKGKKVLQQRVKGEFGERVVVYIEVPFDELINLAR